MRDTVVRYGIVTIFLLILFTGCMNTQKTQEESRTDKFITISSKIIDTGGIKTKKIETSSIEEYTETPGEVIADENLLVNIAPVVRGKVKSVKVNPGDYVNKWDLLCVLSCPELAQAVSDIYATKERMSIASETLQVKEEFAKTGSFSGPPLESKKEALSVAEAELTGAEENLKIAEANREAAGAALKKISAISSTGEFARRPLDEAKGQFAQAESEYLQAKNQLIRAETELHRSEKLYEEGLISGKELLLVQTDYRNATVHLSQTEAQMEVAKGILEREQTIYDSGVRNDTELQDGKAKYIQSEKEYARAEAELKKSRSNLEIMKSQMTREENIYSKDLNTRQELEQASSAYREAKVEYEKSLSVLKTFGISPENASKYSGGDFPVISPIKGYVSERHLNTGEVIAADTVIFKILDSSTLWIDSEVYERDTAKVKIGQTVEIITSAYPNELFRGKIFYISDTLKQETRTFNVRVSFDNRKYLLKPGMTVTSRINTGAITGFILPAEAVMEEEGKYVIFLPVKGKENVFAKREVKAEALKNGAYIINSGLSAGEEVVTTGAFLIKSEENKGNLQG